MDARKCDYLTNRSDITGSLDEYLECLRQDYHAGPHLIQRGDGTYVAFNNDDECGCECCQHEDPENWCQVYWEVGENEAREFLNTR